MAKPSSRSLSYCPLVVLVVLLSIFHGSFLSTKTVHAVNLEPPKFPAILHMYPLTQSAIRVDPGRPLPCLSSSAPPLCYSPQQIRQAYEIQPLFGMGIRGKGRRIAIVDAYQNPNLETDLALFDKIFGLNDPKLNIIAPFGLHPFDPRNGSVIGFSLEIALDVQWAHAIAPDATINLVLANPSSDNLRGQIDGLISATEYAVANNLGDVLSLSVGTGETCYSVEEV